MTHRGDLVDAADSEAEPSRPVQELSFVDDDWRLVQGFPGTRVSLLLDFGWRCLEVRFEAPELALINLDVSKAKHLSKAPHLRVVDVFASKLDPECAIWL